MKYIAKCTGPKPGTEEINIPVVTELDVHNLGEFSFFYRRLSPVKFLF